MKEDLDIMSHDIKICESYLQNYPITMNISYNCSGEKILKWNCDFKTISLHTGTICKRLLEWDIKNRIFGYEYLTRFMGFCIETQLNMVDTSYLKMFHESIEKFLKQNQ